MYILNMGIPRSGTTWAFNVFRNIFEEKDMDYTTVAANSPAEVDQALDSLETGAHAILHFHDVTDKVMEAASRDEFIAFFNFRDPRDVVVSQMRLHKADFEAAAQMTVVAYQSMERASAIRDMMLIPFPHIEGCAPALVYQMAARMGLMLDFCSQQRIVEATSARRHKEILEQKERSDKYFLCNEHIQSGKNGRWKEELTPEQQEIANRVFLEPIRFFGFDCTPQP